MAYQKKLKQPSLKVGLFTNSIFLFLLLLLLPTAQCKKLDYGRNIFVPPNLPENQANVVATKDQPFILKCPIWSNELLDLNLQNVWLKDNERITTNEDATSRIKIVDGNLHFVKINSSDGGVYKCVYGNVLISPTINVNIADIFIETPIKEVVARKGENVLLECQINSSPTQDSQFSWIGNGNKNLSYSQELNIRYNILNSGKKLLITNVQKEDAGTYLCKVKNRILDIAKSVEVNLIVNDEISNIGSSLKFLETFSQNSHLILYENQNYTLDCIANGKPKPRISWVYSTYKSNGTNLIPFRSIVSDGLHDYDAIKLTPDNFKQTGNLTCYAYNNGNQTLLQTLKVSRLPALIKGPESQKLPLAKTVRFECKIGQHFYLIWYKDGSILETGKERFKTKGNELIISNSVESDGGIYQCEVLSNGKAYAIGTASLQFAQVAEQVSVATNLKCGSETSNSILVSWKPPKADVMAYSIHIVETSGGEEKQSVTKNESYQIENLKPHTEYSIYVRAYTLKSASGQSARIFCSTEEDVPSKVPAPLIFERFGPPSVLRIRWNPLKNYEARGEIIYYKVIWRHDDNFNNIRYINGSSTELLIDGIQAKDTYQIKIFPATRKGYPEKKDQYPWVLVPSPSKDILNSTNFTSPTVSLTALNSTSIKVKWVEPERNISFLIGYIITFATYSDRLGDNIIYGPITIYNYSANEYILTNLKEETSYEFFVQAFGELNDESPWESDLSKRKVIKTLSSSQSPVPPRIEEYQSIIGLRAIPISSNEIHLFWDSQKDFDGNRDYIIKYNKVDSSEVQTLKVHTLYAEVKDLIPYTLYEFIVQVAPKGIFSQRVESRTLAGKPGAPLKVSWKVLNRTVQISWEAPSEINGIIEKYIVEYKITATTTTNEKEDSNSNTNSNKSSWELISTNLTLVNLNNLLPNEVYEIRIRAENHAGIQSDPSELIYAKIFRKPTTNNMIGGEDGGGEPKDEPGDSPSSIFTGSSQQLGIILGVSIGIICILICATIILCRNKFFPRIARPIIRSENYSNGINGHGPPKHNSVEMRVLERLTGNDAHLDTKGGSGTTNINGPNQDGISDPLLSKIVRNPIIREQQNSDATINDPESRIPLNP